jgi:hypothetical protein
MSIATGSPAALAAQRGRLPLPQGLLQLAEPALEANAYALEPGRVGIGNVVGNSLLPHAGRIQCQTQQAYRVAIYDGYHDHSLQKMAAPRAARQVFIAPPTQRARRPQP